MIEFIGWAGTAGYLVNHAGFSLRPHYPPRLYFSLNFISAVLLIISSLTISSWHPVVNNGFWAITSLIALVGLKPRQLARSLPGVPWLLGLLALVLGVLILTGRGLDFPILGWVSVATYAVGYIALGFGAIGRRQYLAANLLAALLQIPILIVDQNLPVLGLQIAWAVLSFIGLIKRTDDADTLTGLSDLPLGGIAHSNRSDRNGKDKHDG